MNLFYLILVLFISFPASALEQIGKLKLKSFYLKPTMEFSDSEKASLSLRDSLFSITWDLDENINALIKLGDTSLINEQTLFVNYDEDLKPLFSLIEAYGEFKYHNTVFRMGMLPIPYGTEALKEEESLEFSRSFFFSKHLIGLRDVGLSYSLETKNYFTNIAIHNGEGMINLDGQLWYTGTWGWKFNKRFKLGFMGQKGSSQAISTSDSSFNFLSFNKALPSKWKSLGSYALYEENKIYNLFEINFLNIHQEGVKLGQIFSGNWDFIYNYSDSSSFMFRYQFFDPNKSLATDSIKELSLGVAFKNKTKTSVLYLLATKKYEEALEIKNDSIQISWKITAFAYE